MNFDAKLQRAHKIPLKIPLKITHVIINEFERNIQTVSLSVYILVGIWGRQKESGLAVMSALIRALHVGL